MKKMFTLFMALVTFSALFAQYDKPFDNRGNDNRNASRNDHFYNNNGDDNRNNDSRWNKGSGGFDNTDARMHNDDPNFRPDRAIDMHRNDDRGRGFDRMNDRDRRAEMDRINHDYDRRIDDYRNNRGINNWERNREIDRLKRERAAKLKSFGGGVLLGGVLGFILGTQL